MTHKKLFGAALACALIANSAAVLAENNTYEPAGPILVNERLFISENNAPVMVNDRILVDYEKMFNYAGLYAGYIADEQKIYIDSVDGSQRLIMYIDNPQIELYTYHGLMFESDKKEIMLDVAPQIVNGQPMCPLRGALEAFGVEVGWNDELQTASFYTKQHGPEDITPTLSLEADKTDVNAGDTVTINVKFANANKYCLDEYSLSSITNSIQYDKNAFEFISCTNLPDLRANVNMEITNPDFRNNAVKTIALTLNNPLSDELICSTLTFKALTDNGGSFTLSNGYSSKVGADNEILLSKGKKNIALSQIDTLALDITPVIIK